MTPQVADTSSSAWHFLTEEILNDSGRTAARAGDETGLDAAYLVSVVVEQAVATYGALDGGKRTRSCFARDKKAADAHHRRHRHRPRCPAPTAAVGSTRRRDRDGPEAVRRLLYDVYEDATAAASRIATDSDLVRFVLGRLHAVAATNAGVICAWPWRQRRRRTGLAVPLSLFLRQLYDVSHGTCWHLDEWRRRRDRDELRSLGVFARLLCQNHVQPTEALLDAIQKGESNTFLGVSCDNAESNIQKLDR